MSLTVRRRRAVPAVVPALGLALVLMVTMVACGEERHGDEDAFCELLGDGVGIGSDAAEVSPADFDRLAEVAPDDIAAVVGQLANTARTLDEIPKDDLAGLFAAAFDPDANRARSELLAYAAQQCGIDVEGISDGRVVTDAELAAELGDYVRANFANETWTTKVVYNFIRIDSAVRGIEITFRSEPDDDEPVAACNAVSVFLYEIKDADGAVTVRSPSGSLIAERPGPDDPCALQ